MTPPPNWSQAMKTSIAICVLLLCGGLALHAGDADKDIDRLQGTWLVASLVEEGKAVPADEVATLEITIQKDVFTVNEKGKTIAQYKLKLDPSKKPKAIDLTHLIGEEKGMTEPGIYVFEKDQIRFCLNEGKKERPTTFQGDTYSVMVMKRKPAKDAK
jgi:uncharacterized protein (TIGR03067 family)